MDIQKLHEVMDPTNQESSQSEFPTSGYGQIIEGCAFWKFLDSTQDKSKTGITPSFGLRLRWTTTRWNGNFINFSMDQYFGICSVDYTGENPQGRGRSNMMRNKIEEMRMTTTKRSLGNALIKLTQSNSEAWSKGTTPMTLPNEDTSEQPSTNQDVASKPRRITKATSSCMATSDSCTKDHGFTTTRK